MLEAFLRGSKALLAPKRTYVEALRHAWCWPADEALSASALTRGLQPPAPPHAGQTCIVSVASTGNEPILWELTAGSTGPKRGRATVHDDAATAWKTAFELATRYTPFLRDVALTHAPVTCSAKALLTDADGARPRVLDGPSYGLAMFLAAISLLLATPVLASVAGLARLQADGKVERVDGLDSKLRMIAQGALGVTDVIVAAGQEEEARGIAATLTRKLEIRPVEHVKDAIPLAFTEIRQRLREELRAGDSSLALAEALHKLALDGSEKILSWKSVANTGALLEEIVAPSSPAATAASTARKIARRHCGDPGVLIPWPGAGDIALLRRPSRLKLLAHVVQSAADSDDESSLSYARLASQHVASRDSRHREDLLLQGARGRALAAAGHFAEALEVLHETLEDWFAIGEPREAGYCLCELLRVLGVLGRAEDLDQLLFTWYVRFLQANGVGTESAGYARLAAGRALCQVGRPQDALQYLADGEGVSWSEMRADPQASRLRWQARAARAVGDRDLASSCEAAISWFERETEGRDHVLLARIDASLDGDPEPWLNRILQDEKYGHEARRHDQRIRTSQPDCPVRDRAAYLAEQYRY